MALPDDPSLLIVTDDDPRLRSEYVSLVNADFLNGAIGSGEVTRHGSLVEFYIQWSAPAWTSGDLLLVLPDWAQPSKTRYLPPFYGGLSGTAIAFPGGNVQWYAPQIGPTLRLTATWSAKA